MTHAKIEARLAPLSNASASASRRTITGTVVTFTETGWASNGPTRFSKGSLKLPRDLSAVKLLIQHDTYSAAVGYMTEYAETDSEATATFYVPEGADGDAALVAAADGTRDGLSVGTMITDYDYAADGDTVLVASAELREVSLVTVPAFQSARVTTVTAATDPERLTRMTASQNPAPAQPAVTTPPLPTAAAAAPVVNIAPAANAPAANAPTEADDIRAMTAALRQMIANPQAPQIIPPSNADGSKKSLRTVAAEFAAGYRAGRSPSDLAAAMTGPHPIASGAALNDIIPGNDAGGSGIGRPMWVDELWQASRTDRTFANAATQGPTPTSLKVTGWKRDIANMPTIDPYAGDKAAIPTSTFKTIPATGDIVRRAGGWDFDRAFVDLGDGSFIETTIKFAFDDYKNKSEAYVKTELLAAATSVVPGATFVATLAGLGAAAVTLGSRLDVIALATDQWLALANLKESEVPWWLRSQGELNLGTVSGSAGGLKFECVPELPEGTILAGDGRGYTFYEHPLVQVQALNIPNGGIDLGVFGYLGVIVNDPRSILKIETPAP